MDEEQIKRALAAIPGARRGADGVLIEKELDGQLYTFYATGVRIPDPDLTLEEGFLVGWCTKKEILRLRSISTTHDYLLRFRVNAIADSSRLTRVMAKRRKDFERASRQWTLCSYYDSLNVAIKSYKQRLPRQLRKRLSNVPAGFAPLVEVNAICLKSLVGEVIIISEALRYLYYYTTISLYGLNYGLQLEDCLDAGVLAVRLMLGTEAMDFDMDPRGTLPPRVEAEIQSKVDHMIEFTFGHECAHLLLGHLAGDGVATGHAKNVSPEQQLYSFENEYAADLAAIRMLGGEMETRRDLSIAAYNVFWYLHLVELLSEDFPDIPHFSVSETHPSPLNRLWALRKALGDKGQPSTAHLERVTQSIQNARKWIRERIRTSPQGDLLTMYGSVYLRGLGGKEREDRIAY